MQTDRSAYHHGNLREALVDAAASLLIEHGVHGISLRKVAKAAGVSQAAPYHHFDNKEALLAEVARRGFLELSGQMHDLPGEGPVDRMRQMGERYIAFALAQPQLYQLMFGADFCPTDDHAELKTAANGTFGMLLDAVIEGVASGDFSGEPLAQSMAVWSSVHGIASLLQNRVHQGKEFQGVAVEQQAMIDATLDFVITALTAPSASAIG